ncbi:hypothetical protein NA8A_13644 [Nitratireductor indicus C115]|uniref:Uncharacterized protein n=2 Tax=Nitratireductor indicus TaxID=721133 RepID=K2NV03_9HYPH|nr:hypothetical protein NA8A_13644 [Nitratireductor indicus C115]SFQ37776.1 hypothetical protein SAMN05216176_1033 [Nitratireductor indicus]
MTQKQKRPGGAGTPSEPVFNSIPTGEQMNSTSDSTPPAARTDPRGEMRMERIRRLSQELSNALADWIEEEMQGEKWAIRIFPPASDRHAIFLENLDAYKTPNWDMVFPSSKGV